MNRFSILVSLSDQGVPITLLQQQEFSFGLFCRDQDGCRTRLSSFATQFYEHKLQILPWSTAEFAFVVALWWCQFSTFPTTSMRFFFFWEHFPTKYQGSGGVDYLSPLLKFKKKATWHNSSLLKFNFTEKLSSLNNFEDLTPFC